MYMVCALEMAHPISQELSIIALRRWRLGVADVSHKPDDAKYCQRNQAERDKPYEDHPDPTERRGSRIVAPILHHALRSHHAPATKAPITHQRACSKQDQN